MFFSNYAESKGTHVLFLEVSALVKTHKKDFRFIKTKVPENITISSRADNEPDVHARMHT